MDEQENKDVKKVEEPKHRKKHRKLFIIGVIIVVLGIIALIIARTIEDPNWISTDQSNLFGSDSISEVSTQYSEQKKLDFNDSSFNGDFIYIPSNANEDPLLLGDSPRLFHWNTLDSKIKISNISSSSSVKVILSLAAYILINFESEIISHDDFSFVGLNATNGIIKEKVYSTVIPNEDFSNNTLEYEFDNAQEISQIEITLEDYIHINENPYYFSLSKIQVFFY